MSVEALLCEWERRINTMAGGIYIAGMDKDDIKQELNIVLWQCSESYKNSKGQFSTYFYTCARNKIGKLKKYAMARKRSAYMVPLDDNFDILFDAQYEDIDLLASIELDRNMCAKQKCSMLEIAMNGPSDNDTISVENAKEFIGGLGYNISRKRKR
jgi:DNA-directed RNA polymerase specialized sigma24 family protein